MAMKWSDVAANPAFQALSFDEQEEARNQYFNEVVAPRVSEDEVEAVRGQFLADTQQTLAPVPDTGDETARLAARYKAPEKPGLIARLSSALPKPVDPLGIGGGSATSQKPKTGVIASIGAALKPEFKSVMDGYEPTPQERQAEVDKRLSYGAGPISQKAVAAADSVRSSRGQMASQDPTVNKVVKAMDARGEKSFADIVDSANKPEIVQAVRDEKADEFRTAGEWAADTLSSLSQGAVGLVQLPINIIAPSSEIASTLRKTQKELQAQESDVLKAQREQLRERVQNEDGFLDKYAATVVQLVTSPALGLSEAVKQIPNFLGIVGASRLVGAASAGGVGLVGRASPTVALGEAISGGAIQAGARAAGTTAGGVGASMVMAGGDAAGGVYDKLTDPRQTPLSVWQENPDYQELVASGKTSEQAIVEIATAKARMAALVTAPLGLLGFMGAEAAVASRGLGRATAEALTAAGAGKMLAKDLIGEQLEEGGTQFGGNVISRTVDPSQKLSEGVPEAMATALVTSAPFSAVGAASQYQEARAAQAPDFAAERQAVGLFDVNSYDPTLISPEQTMRRAADVGPSAPAREINFTPAGSPTDEAGLVPIVVPIPNRSETTDVSTLGGAGAAPAVGGFPASDQRGGGLGIPGLDAAGTGQLAGGNAGLPAANAGANVPAGSAGGQQAASLTLPRVSPRATDQDLLARTEAAIAAPENNNAVVQPVEQWVGRKGDGYVTEADAAQALPGRQRMFPSLEWSVEQMPSGKFRLAGYEQQNTQPAPTVGTMETGAGVTQPTQAAPAAEPITAPSGKPFSTQQTAAVYAQQNGITGYSTVKMDGGWVIKPTETTLGTQTPQALQGQTQGQQASAISGATSAGVLQPLASRSAAQAQSGGDVGVSSVATGPNAQAQRPGALGTPEGAATAGLKTSLRLAPPAPLRAIGKAITTLSASTGVDAEVDTAPLTEQQQAASAVARLLGRTVTYLKADTPASLPNGFMLPGDSKNIFVANDADDAPLSVAMHEIYHTLPEPQRKALNTQLAQYFRQDRRTEFAEEFDYDAKNDALLDEEIPAFMVQAISKREDFWQDLRTKMGNAEFGEVAKTILAKLNTIISGAKEQYGDEFVSKYITDVAKARDLLSTAYAESMQAQGLTPDVALVSDAQPMASNRAAPETPEFKKFFGNSKVVDDAGKPMVVYHGTGADITAFKPSDGGSLGEGIYFTDDADAASRFAERKEEDMNVLPVYIKAENILDADNITDDQLAAIKSAIPKNIQELVSLGYPQELAIDSKEFIERDLKKVLASRTFNPKSLWLAIEGGPMSVIESIYKAAGFDAITRMSDGLVGRSPFREYLVFRPEQIKSATGNSGIFDPANPDIRMSRRGTTAAGEFDVRTMKDGTMVVYGDPEQIRAQVPDDVKGRVTKDGIVFTNAAAPRVRAALEGRQVAYSRGGEVTEKLPMKNGKYLGAPEKFNTPGKIPTLRKILRQLADEGAPGRYWYENSGKAVLKMVGGDMQEARKFVALLAIYSPQAKVDANSTFALRAWAQYKAGQPISVKTEVMDTKAKGALDDVDAFWSGEKTGNFFFNLLREIDPSTAGKQGATIDMWMMRAGQYETDAPSNTQYSFMENETNRLARELGWEPQQVQAAIWVAMKARMENKGVKKETERTSEKKGWIKFVPGKDGKGKVRVILDEQKHRDNWLKYSFAHDVTKDDTQQAKFDFGDGLMRHIGQVSFEARPGRTSAVLPGIHSAPYAQQVEFQQAVQKAFYNERGTDELAAYLGLLVDSDILAPGVWQGEVSPSTQLNVAMAPAKGTEGKTNVDPAQATALNIYAAVAGLVARQEGVGWHRPFYSSTKRDANGLDINVGRTLNPREVADLETAVGDWMVDNGHPEWQDKFAFVSSPNGIRVVNFGIITNEKLQSDIVKVAESVLPDFEYRVFASSGDMPTNNWKESPNGESYVQRIGAEGRSDVLYWARAVLAPRVQQVFDEYADKYGWGDAGQLRFSQRAGDGSRGQGAGGAQDRQVQAPERADAQAVRGLSANEALPGAPTVRGFTGPDPRLVAVAEQYARDNGIELRRQAEYAQVDPERAARIAEAYEAMPHAPQDLRVKAAYKELIAQTLAQYRALEKAGYKFWFINLDKPDNQEYASSPWNAMRDIRANKVMGVFPTDDGFGSGDFDPASNPLLEDTGIKWPSGSLFGPRKRVLANDLFRAVHDAFGHGLEGSGFRAQGEENAWQAHVRLFTGSAVAAITSETRGQNSWLNYGPNGESNRTAKVEDTVFADQKTGLLPEWAWTEGRVGDMPMFSNRAKPAFYSQLERTIANVPAKLATQPASQWALWLDSNGPKQGVKKDEMEWSGIKDYLTLRGKDKVTSAELQAYLADSGVRVSEQMLGDIKDFSAMDDAQVVKEYTRIRGYAPEANGEAMSREEILDELEGMLDEDADDTKYGKYTLPGGENYRELLITLPEVTGNQQIRLEGTRKRLQAMEEMVSEFAGLGLSEKAAQFQVKADNLRKEVDALEKAPPQKRTDNYRSSHWDEKNVLAHIRINDRTDADGKRVLFVEEVQSDWGQTAKKEGTGDTLKTGWKIVEQEPGFFHLKEDGYSLPRAFGTKDAVMKAADRMGALMKGVPAAPFIGKTEGWLNLALKRIAMMAVEGGYDKVAFVNGEQSADRYDLSKQIQSIAYSPEEKLLDAWDNNRRKVMRREITDESQLEDYVGKEVAKRLLAQPLVMGKHLLDGEDIKVGGEGMKAFYDQIVPQAITKLLPKLGGEKLGSVGVPLPVGNGEKTPAGAVQWVINVDGREYNGYSDEGVARQELAELLEDGKNAELIDERNPEVSQQPGFDVTDKMRETVGQGLPMFSNRAADKAKSVATPEVRTSNRRQKLIGSTFELPATGKVDAARIKLQDDGLRMKRVIEAVEAKKGSKVSEAQNFYDANTLMPGRIQAAMDDFRDNVMRPLIDKAVGFGIDLDELALYSYAKHAEERNAYIASINKRMPDGGSGMTDAHAKSILQLAKASGDEAKFEELHRDLMAITSTTRQVMLAEGLITQDEFDALDGAYENYIPLRGLENVDENTGAMRPGIGRGINVRGGETIRAMGRKSQASDLIENVIRDYQRVIMRVEKNDVGKVLLDFVLSNPDPDLWGVDVERNKPAFNKATGTVQYTKSIEKGEDTIGVKVGGQQVYIKLADPELARAIRQAWKDETSGLERATLAVSGWWNNWLRNVLTRYNPAFAAINIPRDALWSGTSAALAELGPKGLAKYLANYGKALMASARQEAGIGGTANKIIGNQQMDQRFQEFRNAGSITGGFYMRSLDDINKDLRNEMLLAGAKSKNTFEAIKSLPPYKLATLTARMLEFMGSASENATRFALYQAAREVGKTPTQAALLAKDGTTNFNRKGEWGGALNNMYLFFNAAVQGNAQLVKVLKSPAVQASMAGVAGVGMMLALYGASAGGEDDDGEAYWDKVPSYVKERNLVFMLPPGDALADGIERAGKRGRYFTIPVQYGFNIFPNAGYVMADVWRNAQDPKRGMTPTKAALHMTSTVFGSVNPFGGAVDFGDGVQVLLAAMPTLIDLPVQLINERGTFGSPSAPERSPFDVRPDSSRMFVSQMNTLPEKVSKALNEMGGGNEAKPGKVLGVETSVTPGTIQTLISATTGGLGSFVEQVGSSVIAMSGDDKDVKAAKIPFLNKFYGEVDESANIRSAGDRMREIKKLSDQVKAQQKVGLNPELDSDEERLLGLAGMQEAYQKQQTAMRKAEIAIIKDKDMTEAEKKLQRRQLQVERDRLATDVNREYLKSMK